MTPTLITLVTGSRSWTDRDAVWRELDELAKRGKVIVYEGDADGGDRHAKTWALSGRAYGLVTTPALWKRHGYGAGPKRNHRQAVAALYEFNAIVEDGGKAELICLAFPLPRRRADKPSGTEGQMELCAGLGFEVLDRGRR